MCRMYNDLGCLDAVQRRLKGEILKDSLKMNKANWAIWRVFRDVTDLHGQIYLVRDIASPMKLVNNVANNSTSYDTQ